MKVFISQPMNGLTDEEILRVRNQAEAYLNCVYGSVDIIESFFHENPPEKASRLWFLGASIQLMHNADLVYFCEGWKKAPGCRVERCVCEQYGIPILEG